MCPSPTRILLQPPQECSELTERVLSAPTKHNFASSYQRKIEHSNAKNIIAVGLCVILLLFIRSNSFYLLFMYFFRPSPLMHGLLFRFCSLHFLCILHSTNFSHTALFVFIFCFNSLSHLGTPIQVCDCRSAEAEHCLWQPCKIFAVDDALGSHCLIAVSVSQSLIGKEVYSISYTNVDPVSHELRQLHVTKLQCTWEFSIG